MAKVGNNIFIRGLSGVLGQQFVVRTDKAGRTIISIKPGPNPNLTFNAAQVAHQNAFREAIAYAKVAKDQPVYIAKAQATLRKAFNLAVADWFNKPEILELDVSGWTGEINQSIRVKAQDDTQVVKVQVVIRAANGALLEQGEAVPSEWLWWTYHTQTLVPMTLAPQVTATAQDLPGHWAERVWTN